MNLDKYLVPVLLAAAFVAVPDCLQAAIWRVPTQAPTIQAGLDLAAAGDTVLVDAGTYEEHDIQMKSGVCLLGDPADPESVVIDAFGQGRVIDASGTTSLTEINGLTLLRGEAPGPDFIGGGLHCDDGAALSLRNLVIRSCEANLEGSGDGAGIFFRSAEANPVSPEVLGCVFQYNRSRNDGGAVYCEGYSTPEFRDCQFLSNSTIGLSPDVFGDGAGAALVRNRSTRFVGCRFYNNGSGWTGGAASLYDDSDAEFEECTFIGNSAGYYGGAINCDLGSTVRVSAGEFRSNVSIVYDGGAVHASEGSLCLLQDCLLTNNNCPKLGQGGALACRTGGSMQVMSCTFVANWCSGFGGAAAVTDQDCRIEFSSCILAGNMDRSVYDADPAGESFTFTCSDIFGNEGGDWVAEIAEQVDLRGNFSADPCFCDPTGGDFRLCADSWCLPGNHPWGCDELVGRFGPGCDGCGCGGPVATFLDGFEVRMDGPVVELAWSVAEEASGGRFRLTGALGELEWELPVRPAGGGHYAARDESVALAAGGEVLYSLFHRDGEEPWLLLATEKIEVEARPFVGPCLHAFPNPFNPQVTVSFTADPPGRWSLSVFDLTGRRVAVLADQLFESGDHSLPWDGNDDTGRPVASGTFLVRLEGPAWVESEKLILMR